MSTPQQQVFQRLRQKTATEKQARLGAILQALRGRVSAGIGNTISGAKKVAPYAATAGVAGGVGHNMGFNSGDAAGYGRGSAEGGANAMHNLYRGMYDLMEQGAKSKTDLSNVLKLNKQGSAVNPHRVKIARHILNMKAIERELAAYDFDGLCKSASTSATRSLRIKYAALKAQHLIEKQAFMGALMRGMQMATPLVRAGMQGLGMAGRGIGQAASGMKQLATAGGQAMAPHLRAGMQAAGQAGANVMRANPGAAAAGIGAAGLGAGLAAPAMGRAINNNMIQPVVGAGQSAVNSVNRNLVQPVMGAGRSAYNTAQNVGTRLGNAGNALFGPMPQ